MNPVRVVTYFPGILSVILFILFSSDCQAQPDLCTPGPGQFTGALQIRPGIGCLPLKINATSGLRNVKNVRYIYDYQGGTVKDSELTSDSSFTYHQPGLYRVLQYSEQEGRQLRACAIVQVYDTIAPEVVTTSCQTNITLSIPKAVEYQYDWYIIDWGDGNHSQVGGPNPTESHTYPNENQRAIAVRGVHLYGDCGGTTKFTFRPATKAGPPVIDQLKPVSANAIELTISNPGGNRFWIEQRTTGGAYVRTTNHDETTLVIRKEADTTVSVCFRLVLADTCLQAPPSADVCFVPKKTPEPIPVADSTMYLPDAFSPNADGINDRFQPQGLVSGTLRLTVYNRWGEVIFWTEDAMAGWDGKQRDQPVPPGTYSYLLDLEKPGGKQIRKRGKVVLMK